MKDLKPKAKLVEKFLNSSAKLVSSPERKKNHSDRFESKITSTMYVGWVLAYEHQFSIITKIRNVLSEKVKGEEINRIMNNLKKDDLGEYSKNKEEEKLQTQFFLSMSALDIAKNRDKLEPSEALVKLTRAILYQDRKEFLSEHLELIFNDKSSEFSLDKIKESVLKRVKQAQKDGEIPSDFDFDELKKVVRDRLKDKKEESIFSYKPKGGAKFLNNRDHEDETLRLEKIEHIKSRARRFVDDFGGLRQLIKVMDNSPNSEFIISPKTKQQYAKTDALLALTELREHGLHNPCGLKKDELLDGIKLIEQGIRDIPSDIKKTMNKGSLKALIHVSNEDETVEYNYSLDDLKFMLREFHGVEGENKFAI